MQLPWEPSLSVVINQCCQPRGFHGGCHETCRLCPGFVLLSFAAPSSVFPNLPAFQWLSGVEAIIQSSFDVIPLCLKQITTLGLVKYICIFLLDVKEALRDKPRLIQMPELQVFINKYIPSGLVFLASQGCISQWWSPELLLWQEGGEAGGQQ